MAVRDDFAAGEVLAAADLNDTFASKLPYSYGTATPSTSVDGFLWYDENSTPPAPKFWDGSSFVAISSKPYIGFSETTAGVSTTSTSPQDVGAATVTFTAPPSGEVYASVEAMFSVSGGNLDGLWGFRDNSTGTVLMQYQLFAASGADNSRRTIGYKVTGLTPGSSYTWKLAVYTGNASYTVSVASNTGAKVKLMIQEL